MNKLTLLLLSLLMVSCAHYSPIYWGWGEWVTTDVENMGNDLVAYFDWSTLPGVITSIDRNAVGSGYKKAKLLSGPHEIEYAYYPAEFGVHPKEKITMQLEAGHSYEFRIKLCFWCSPRRYSVWVDDKNTGETVWGKHPA
jgi:hypothetical protein